jgi:hypothetical protein
LDSSDEDPTEVAYSRFLETYLAYQRLFEYSGDIDSVLEMPYSLYTDLIMKQVDFKKKEKEEFDKLKSKTSQNKGRK